MTVRNAVRAVVRNGVRLAMDMTPRRTPNVPPSPEWELYAPRFVTFAGQFDMAMNARWPAR